MWRWLLLAFVVTLVTFLTTLAFTSREAQSQQLVDSPSLSSGTESQPPPLVGTAQEMPQEAVRPVSQADAGPSNDTFGSAISYPEATSSPGGIELVAVPAGQVLNQAAELDEPVIEESVQTLKPAPESVEPLIEEASPLLQAVDEAADSRLTMAEETVAPISEAAGAAVAPAVGLVDKVAEPVAFSEISAPTLAPFTDEASPVLSPLGLPLEAVSALVPAEPALEPAKTANTLADSGIASIAQANLEGSASNGTAAKKQATMRTDIPSGSYLEQLVSLFDEALIRDPLDRLLFHNVVERASVLNAVAESQALCDYTTGNGTIARNLSEMEGTQAQVPQPVPTDAITVTGYVSGGSSSGSGGAFAPDSLGLLVVLVLGGKFLWSVYSLLKPSLILTLAIERPD